MKTTLSVLSLLLSSLVPVVGFDAQSIRKSSSYREARARGAEAVVRLDVSDEDNLAVSNATVYPPLDIICKHVGRYNRCRRYLHVGECDSR